MIQYDAWRAVTTESDDDERLTYSFRTHTCIVAMRTGEPELKTVGAGIRAVAVISGKDQARHRATKIGEFATDKLAKYTTTHF